MDLNHYLEKMITITTFAKIPKREDLFIKELPQIPNQESNLNFNGMNITF